MVREASTQHSSLVRELASQAALGIALGLGFCLLIALIALLLAYPAGVGAQRKTLDIYWIDVEGGAATLLISPEGESLLYDAGWDVENRDAHRIAEVAKQAGLSRIDLFVLSHFHADHAGGLTALAALMPIGHYFDHGNTVVDADLNRLITYAGVAGRHRTGRSSVARSHPTLGSL